MRKTLVKSEEFKDSPVGRIPKDWDVVTVESIADDKPYAVVDGPFGSNLKTEHYREYGIPVIQSGFVTSGVFLAESYVYVARELFQAQKRSAVEPGDIVMAKIGAQCGTSAILPANHPVGILAGNSLKISTNPDKCRAAYLLRILHYYYDTGQIDLIKTETAQPAISLKNLRALKTPLPLCVKEQDAITSILDALDETIAHTSSLIAKLKQMKAGLLHDLLTRGLDEKGELRDAIGYPEQFKDSPLGRIPKDWKVQPLSELADVDRGKFTHRPRNDPRFYGGSYPFIQTGDIAKAGGGKLAAYSQTLIERGITVSREFPIGTIAITIAANIADTAILSIPMFFPDSIVGAIVKQPNSIRYVELSIRCAKQQLDARAPQSAEKNINLEDLRPLLIAVPEPKEQYRIAEVYEAHDTRIHSEEAYRDKLKLQKKGLMHDLLTGKVRVKDVDKFTPASDTV